MRVQFYIETNSRFDLLIYHHLQLQKKKKKKKKMNETANIIETKRARAAARERTWTRDTATFRIARCLLLVTMSIDREFKRKNQPS
jgi:hypothetical protein